MSIKPGTPVKPQQSLAAHRVKTDNESTKAFIDEWGPEPSIDFQYRAHPATCRPGKVHVECLDLSVKADAEKYAWIIENQVGETNARGTVKVLETPVEVPPDPGKKNFRVRVTYRELLFQKRLVPQQKS